MKKRRWLVAAVFVWTVVGAVALATYTDDHNSKLVVLPDAQHDHASHAGQPHVDPPAPGTAPDAAPALKEPVAAQKQPALKQPKLTAIAWEPSFEEAMTRAKRENKPLMIDVYATWCGPCKMMEKEVYTDPDVIAQSANWVSVKIDGEKRPDVAQAYGVKGYPTILFVHNSGKPFAILPGAEAAPAFVQTMRDAYAKWSPSQV